MATVEASAPQPATHVNGGPIEPSADDVVMSNGDHSTSPSIEKPANEVAIDEHIMPKSELATNDATPALADNGTAPISAPIEHVAPGITPVSAYLPKDAANSHPTPPPDDSPIAPAAPDADTEMGGADDAPVSQPTESGLVRPREDDGEPDEPSAKRSKVDDEVKLENGDSTMSDAPEASSTANLVSRPATQPTESAESDAEASAGTEIAAPSIESDVKPEIKPEVSTLSQVAGDATPAPTDAMLGVTSTDASEPAQSIEVKTEGVPIKSEAAVAATSDVPSKPAYSSDALTPLQSRFLQDKLKNLKKTKNSIPFLNPVDPVALNIPTYPDIIKNPMDLTTMETKLKNNQYSSVQAFVDDFDLIINNTRTFNGPLHVVTQTGASMEAYFRKMMESVPGKDEVAPQKPIKRQSPSAQKNPALTAPRRESRSANAPAPAPAPAPVPPPAPARTAAPSSETFALQPDGTPQIRRDSSINRPNRTIKPPANRELTYAKPKRKEHQLELKFCEHVLTQVRSPRYAAMNIIFQEPVDPVALNIPHYRNIVKHPMDLATMNQKLKSGQYGKASEFKKDFDLMIDNCLLFNPVGNPVRDIGVAFRREFMSLWDERTKWEAQQKAAARRDDSDDESVDEDEDDEEDVVEDQTATILALQKQLADMQSALAGLNKPVKASKKSKSSSGLPKSSKKSSSGSGLSKQKSSLSSKPSKPKKPKQVSYDEKQEISEAVNKMSPNQIEDLTKIITNNCSKYADQEEMELEIDDLPNNVQLMLLEFVRKQFGNPKRPRAVSPDDIAAMDDDDFEPAERGAGRKSGGSKRKKHKPMGKKEQQDTISNIQKQLAQFQNPITSGSESPEHSSFATGRGGHADAETSGDDSDESEEE